MQETYVNRCGQDFFVLPGDRLDIVRPAGCRLDLLFAGRAA
jgi:hypothetical protein